MWAAIISGLIAVASAVVQGAMQSSENEKARKEAERMAGVQRADQLKVNAQNNQLARKSLALTDDKLAWQQMQANRNIQDKENDKSYLTGKMNTQVTQDAVSKIFEPKQDSRLVQKQGYL